MMIETLGRTWRNVLRDRIADARREVLISSPYVTRDGCQFCSDCMSDGFRRRGELRLLSDLSPMNLVQRSTDPAAIQGLLSEVSHCQLRHLPQLHAKVYVFDSRYAIVTSANLTNSGLYLNFELGMGVSDPRTVAQIRHEVIAYSELGAEILSSQLDAYCEMAARLRERYAAQLTSISQMARSEFQQSIEEIETHLIRLRTSSGPVTSLFAQTIAFLLERHGPLPTSELHPLIKGVHPDLCDDSVDRVIDGVHFGKKWKHWVRSAQQRLKSNGTIKLENGKWKLAQ